MYQKWLDNQCISYWGQMPGFHYQLNVTFLTNLGLSPSDKRKYIKKIQDKALTASAWIWQSHRVMTIQV